MKIKDLIEELERMEKKYGNVECDMYMEDIDGVKLGVDEISCIEETYETDNTVASICIMHKNKED